MTGERETDGDRGSIAWRVHLRSPPSRVFPFLASAPGRARFWADSAEEDGGVIRFRFGDGTELESRILASDAPHRFALTYFGGSRVTFELRAAEGGGTDLRLREDDVPAAHRDANRAGWVSVLLGLKAAVDHGVDLRNHDPERSWGRGYVDV